MVHVSKHTVAITVNELKDLFEDYGAPGEIHGAFLEVHNRAVGLRRHDT
jgi:hypothetical protein